MNKIYGGRLNKRFYIKERFLKCRGSFRLILNGNWGFGSLMEFGLIGIFWLDKCIIFGY